MVWTIKLLIIFGATVTYAGSINSERQNTSNSNVTWNDSTIVVAEGVKIIADSVNQLTKPIHNVITSTPLAPTPNTIVTINETQIANFTSSFNNISSSTSTTTTTTAATHKILHNYQFASTAAPPNSTATSTTTTLKTIPVNEIEVGEKNDNRTSVAKKGFGVNETGELLSSTTTPKPKKPTVTIGNDDTIDSVGNNATRTITNPNMNLSPVSQKTDYIVPIVGVILSVPLVAILLNLVYRKTKDWWQYRHYKRMDLIDGIYNN